MITKTSEVRVRFAETDAMGVVYHSNYLPWCEVSRINLISSIGLSYKKLSEEGYHLPVLEAHMRYKFPARFDDLVKIKATIKDRPALRVKIEYEITSDGRLLATGYTMHAFVNKSGMPVKPPREFIKTILDAYDADEK